MSIPLSKWAIGGVMIVTLGLAVTGLITETLQIHGLGNQVSTEELGELERLQNSTGISQTAQRQAEGTTAETDFFSLPGVLNTFRTVFESIGIWEVFINVGVDILGIQHATNNWPEILAVSAIMIMISYRFVKEIR